MQENFRSNKIKKVSAVLLVVFFCAFICASFLCAITLPFSKGVAMAGQSDVMLETASDASASADVPTYAEGVKRGVYVDTSSFVSVPFTDLTADTDIYGFYYDVSLFRLSGNYDLIFEFGSDVFPSRSYLDFTNSSGLGSDIGLFVPSFYGTSFIRVFLMQKYVSSSVPSLYTLNCFTSFLPFRFSESAITIISSNADYFDGYWYAITESPSGVTWSPDAFSSRFVTPVDSPSRTVYFNLSTFPTAPDLKYFVHWVRPGQDYYYYDYFSAYDTSGFAFGANNVVTVGWYVVKNNDTYFLTLRCLGQDVFSYEVSGDFSSGVVSNQKWLVASNFRFGNLMLYSFDFSGSSSYFTLSDGSFKSIELQFGQFGWSNWLSLFDLSNFTNLSSGVYTELGYAQAKTYYEDLLTKERNDSYVAGKTAGYNEGYNAGKDVSRGYTFLGLIGAVIDAPIEAFKGLFDFEILGVDMSSFVLSLLTLSVVIIVIRMALGGK